MTAILTIAEGVLSVVMGVIVAIVACMLAVDVAAHLPIFPRLILLMACGLMFLAGAVAVNFGIEGTSAGINAIGGDHDDE